MHRVVSAHVGLGEVPVHGDTVGPGVGQGPRRQQWMAQPGQTQDTTRYSLGFRNLLAVQ